MHQDFLSALPRTLPVIISSQYKMPHHCALAQLHPQEQLVVDEGVVKVSCDARMGTTLCKLHVSVLEQWPQKWDHRSWPIVAPWLAIGSFPVGGVGQSPTVRGFGPKNRPPPPTHLTPKPN